MLLPEQLPNLIIQQSVLVWSQFVAHTTMKRWWRWYNIVLTFVLLLSPIFTVLGVEIFVKRKSDLNTVAGARAELVCEVRDLRDELKYCEWFSPNGNYVNIHSNTNKYLLYPKSRKPNYT